MAPSIPVFGEWQTFCMKLCCCTSQFFSENLGKDFERKTSYMSSTRLSWCLMLLVRPKILKCFATNSIRYCLFDFIVDLVINIENTQIDTRIGYPFQYPKFSSNPDYSSMIYWKINLIFLYYSRIIINVIDRWTVARICYYCLCKDQFVTVIWFKGHYWRLTWLPQFGKTNLSLDYLNRLYFHFYFSIFWLFSKMS